MKMKKLLTIFAIIAVLCTFCTVAALAADAPTVVVGTQTETYDWSTLKYEDGGKHDCKEGAIPATVKGVADGEIILVNAVIPHTWATETAGADLYKFGTAPTCTDPGSYDDYCTVCNALRQDVEEGVETVNVPALGHDFSVKVNVVEAACVDGSYNMKCVRCDAIEQETVKKGGKDVEQDKVYTIKSTDPNAHVYTEWGKEGDPETDYKAPTCISEGYSRRYCTKCSKVFEKTLPKLDHTFDTIVSTKELSCTKMEVTYKCSTCKVADPKIKDKDIATNTVEVTIDNHDVAKWTLNVTNCTKGGTETGVCKKCGETVSNPVAGKDHDGTWVKRGTTEDAKGEKYSVYVFNCKNCSYQEQKVVKDSDPAPTAKDVSEKYDPKAKPADKPSDPKPADPVVEPAFDATKVDIDEAASALTTENGGVNAVKVNGVTADKTLYVRITTTYVAADGTLFPVVTIKQIAADGTVSFANAKTSGTVKSVQVAVVDDANADASAAWAGSLVNGQTITK